MQQLIDLVMGARAILLNLFTDLAHLKAPIHLNHQLTDQQLSIDRCLPALLNITSNHVLQIIDRIQIHIVDTANGRVDIARHRQVNHQHRLITPAFKRAQGHGLIN